MSKLGEGGNQDTQVFTIQVQNNPTPQPPECLSVKYLPFVIFYTRSMLFKFSPENLTAQI